MQHEPTNIAIDADANRAIDAVIILSMFVVLFFILFFIRVNLSVITRLFVASEHSISLAFVSTIPCVRK